MRQFFLFASLFVGGYTFLHETVGPTEEQEGQIQDLRSSLQETCHGLRDPAEIRDLELRVWEARERIFFDPLTLPWHCELEGGAVEVPAV